MRFRHRKTAWILAVLLLTGVEICSAMGASTATIAVPDSLKNALKERLGEYQPWIDILRKRTATEVEKLQKWQYRVVRVKGSDTVELTLALNKLGEQGWECFHVVSSAPGAPGQLPTEHLLFFRKRPKSWLNQLPLRELLKLLYQTMNESGDQKP